MTFIDRSLTPERLAQIQRDGLRWTVRHAWENAPAYRQRLAAAGLDGPEDVRGLDDLTSLPFIDKEQLQAGYPFPPAGGALRGPGAHPRLVRHHRQAQGPVLHPKRRGCLGATCSPAVMKWPV